MVPVKIVLFCNGYVPGGGHILDEGGFVHNRFKDDLRLGEWNYQVIYKPFGGYLSGNNLSNFMIECGDADVVILDSKNASWDASFIDIEVNDLFSIAERIHISSNARIFAQLNKAGDKTSVHEHKFVTPVAGWGDDWIIRALKISGAIKNPTLGWPSKKYILVVDHQENNLIAAEKQLGSLGRVLVETNYIRAMDILDIFQPNMVFTNLMFPAECENLSKANKAYYRFSGQEMDMGLYVAIKALEQKVENIFVVSDMKPRSHPVVCTIDKLQTDGPILFFCDKKHPTIRRSGMKVTNWLQIAKTPRKIK